MQQALLPSESINHSKNKQKMSHNEHKSSPYSSAHQQTQTMSRSNGGKPGNSNIADDATHIRLLQEAFETANKTGTLEKKMLTPAVCRTDAMKLWREVLNNNVYNGLRYNIYQQKYSCFANMRYI